MLVVVLEGVVTQMFTDPAVECRVLMIDGESRQCPQADVEVLQVVAPFIEIANTFEFATKRIDFRMRGSSRDLFEQWHGLVNV